MKINVSVSLSTWSEGHNYNILKEIKNPQDIDITHVLFNSKKADKGWPESMGKEPQPTHKESSMSVLLAGMQEETTARMPSDAFIHKPNTGSFFG